jgi:hypothetical protein
MVIFKMFYHARSSAHLRLNSCTVDSQELKTMLVAETNKKSNFIRLGQHFLPYSIVGTMLLFKHFHAATDLLNDLEHIWS